jgi:hypothetical protein
MGERRRKADQTRFFVDGGRLNGCDLMAAERLAHDVEAARECGVTKPLIRLAWARGANGRHQRLLGIGQFGLRLRQRGSDRADRFTGPLHRYPHG